MLNFVLIAAIIVVAALVLLVRSLFSNKHQDVYARTEQNILYARQRLSELEEQQQIDKLSREDYEQLKLEIENNLALDLEQQKRERSGKDNIQPNSNKALALGLCFALPLMAVGFYWLTGTPEALTTDKQQITNQQPTAENIMQMVETIDLRLQQNPNDLAGWKVIAPIYRGLNQLDNASLAYSRIIELGGADAATYAEHADTLALAAAGVITPEAAISLQQSLNLDPDNQLALWLAGLSAMQDNDSETAIGHWQHLVSLMDASPQQQQELRSIIEQARQNNTVLTDNNASTDAPGIAVSVSLDASLASIVDTEDTVFVVAVARSGPPAPLAVKRLKVKDLPTRLTLSDADAMLPQLKLSVFDQVEVSARISKSGQAIPQAGDLSSDKVSRDKQGDTFDGPLIELKINQQIGAAR